MFCDVSVQLKQWSLLEVQKCGDIKVMMDFVKADSSVVVAIRHLDFQDETLLTHHDDVGGSSMFSGATNHRRWTALHCFTTTLHLHSFDQHRQFAAELWVKSISRRTVFSYSMFTVGKKTNILMKRCTYSRLTLWIMTSGSKFYSQLCRRANIHKNSRCHSSSSLPSVHFSPVRMEVRPTVCPKRHRPWRCWCRWHPFWKDWKIPQVPLLLEAWMPSGLMPMELPSMDDAILIWRVAMHWMKGSPIRREKVYFFLIIAMSLRNWITFLPRCHFYSRALRQRISP